MPELLAEQHFDVGFIVNHENEKIQVRAPDLAMVAAQRGRTILNSVNSPGCVSIGMLLDNDIVTDGQTKPSSLANGLCREERIKHLFLHLRRNARAVVADPDFDAVAEVLGRGSKRRLVVASIRFRFTLRRRIEAV